MMCIFILLALLGVIHSTKVLIIGGGVAGISAAKYLNDKGFETLILEARGRLLGRVFTNKELGYPVDLGASWIHGDDEENPISRISKETN